MESMSLDCAPDTRPYLRPNPPVYQIPYCLSEGTATVLCSPIKHMFPFCHVVSICLNLGLCTAYVRTVPAYTNILGYQELMQPFRGGI